MYLLTEWEGRKEKNRKFENLARGHALDLCAMTEGQIFSGPARLKLGH